MSQTLEQKRAQYAHAFIQAEQHASDTDKLKTLIPKIPIQIIQNGLGQTLAFLLADAGGENTASKRLYHFVQIWLCEEGDERPCQVYSEDANLIEQVIGGDRSNYMRAQQEVLALFNWVKKFADAWL